MCDSSWLLESPTPLSQRKYNIQNSSYIRVGNDFHFSREKLLPLSLGCWPYSARHNSSHSEPFELQKIHESGVMSIQAQVSNVQRHSSHETMSTIRAWDTAYDFRTRVFYIYWFQNKYGLCKSLHPFFISNLSHSRSLPLPRTVGAPILLWYWIEYVGCIIYVIEQHEGIKSMRAFHHFCILLTHTHTAGEPYRTYLCMPHDILINAKTMYGYYTHTCTRVSEQWTHTHTHTYTLSWLNSQGTRRTWWPHPYNSESDGGWHAQWRRLHGVEHVPYECVCALSVAELKMKIFRPFRWNFSRRKYVDSEVLVCGARGMEKFRNENGCHSNNLILSVRKWMNKKQNEILNKNSKIEYKK